MKQVARVVLNEAEHFGGLYEKNKKRSALNSGKKKNMTGSTKPPLHPEAAS